jgi:hypothetical protein
VAGAASLWSEMTENVLILPVWKKGATAEEWFYDLALLARTHPERFSRMVLIYEEISEDGQAAATTTTATG